MTVETLERILEDSLEEINGEDRIRDVNGHLSGVIDDPDDVELELVSGAVVAVENGVRYEIESDLDADHFEDVDTSPRDEDGKPNERSLEILVDVADELDLNPEEVEGALERAGVFQLVEEEIPILEAEIGSEDDEERSPIEIPPETEPPGGAPKYLVEGLQKQSPGVLLDLAKYARGLSEQKTREAERELEDTADVDEDEVPEEWDSEEWEETLEDADAPSGATITTKTIDGRGYYYYQWREGDKIKSEYLAPVSPSSGGD